jgi:cyclopropane-fatty-acyl-phospholipid synthase
MQTIYKILETDCVPEPLIRVGIQKMLSDKLSELHVDDLKTRQHREESFARDLRTRPVAIKTDAANEQHYEVPTEFFKYVLGPHMKYSCALWNDGDDSLRVAEENMLKLTCQRARITNGDTILELGCGWGSLSLWMAEHYPKSQITAVSNSATQKLYIDDQARQRSLKNLTVVTANMIDFQFDEKVDRVVSVEMFEHLKNYAEMFKRIDSWLKPNGLFFMHIFTHKFYPYHYENLDGSDWLTEHFFEGGMMPSNNLPTHFQDDLICEEQWEVSGVHYQKTAEEWLVNMKNNRAQIEPILARTYGEGEVRKWWVYWKLFFLACAELWGYKDGTEWMVCHYLFRKRQSND